jgi:hypothetical protein
MLAVIRVMKIGEVNMFKKGNRMFSISTWMILVIAGLHTMGVFRKPSSPEEVRVVDAMKGQHFHAMGMNWTIHDVLIGIALTMSIQLAFMVAANFFVLYACPSPIIRRRWIIVNAVFMWTLAALFGFYQIPPPFVSFVFLGILFTISFALCNRRQST